MAGTAMTATFLAVIGGASLLAVTARLLRPSDRLPSLEGWALADRSLGPVWTWLLLGGTIFTAYTFTAVPGLAYGNGGAAFFAVPYTVIVCPIAFVLLSRLGEVAHAARLHHRRRLRARPLRFAAAGPGGRADRDPGDDAVSGAATARDTGRADRRGRVSAGRDRRPGDGGAVRGARGGHLPARAAGAHRDLGAQGGRRVRLAHRRDLAGPRTARRPGPGVRRGRRAAGRPGTAAHSRAAARLRHPRPRFRARPADVPARPDRGFRRRRPAHPAQGRRGPLKPGRGCSRSSGSSASRRSRPGYGHRRAAPRRPYRCWWTG